MPWFRVEESFHYHPKVRLAGNAAVGLWVRCGTYSAQYLTDGHVPPDIAAAYGRTREIEALVAARLWLPNDGGFLMPDFLEYNPSAEQVRTDRLKARERQRRLRGRARQARRVALMSRRESRCDIRRCHAVSHAPPTDLTDRPDRVTFTVDLLDLLPRDVAPK